MMRPRPFMLLPLAALLAMMLTLSCSPRHDVPQDGVPSGDIIIFHAGSLSVPFKEIAAAFTKEYPEINVMREAAGSRACARKIRDLKKPCDVIASADYTVIENLLIPEYATWCIKFANNEMAIVYRDASRRADEITAQNWYDILTDDNVAFGRSDPDADPCGYRTILTIKLAEKHCRVSGLARRLLTKDLAHIRPKETDLLALLEAGEIDYIFLYRSVAEQHGLKYIVLPDEINLKAPRYAPLYAGVSVTISGKRPGSTIRKKGEPMIYGVTIPSTAPNRKAALAFVEFLLDKDKGMAIMARNGQPSLVPSSTATFSAIPEPLRKFARRPK